MVYFVSSPTPIAAPSTSQRRRSPVLRSRAVTQQQISHISWSKVTVSKSQLAPSSTGLAAAPKAARMRALRPPPSSPAISAARTIITAPARARPESKSPHAGAEQQFAHARDRRGERGVVDESPGEMARAVEVVQLVTMEPVQPVGRQVECEDGDGEAADDEPLRLLGDGGRAVESREFMLCPRFLSGDSGVAIVDSRVVGERHPEG